MNPKAFGVFLPPYHDPAKSPHTALRDDIELCGLADDLGYDEMWLGEHHSGGWGTLSSPELLIAALARETRRIRFATGITPLPYHHPLHVAERIALVDHLSAGRVILGCGTGTYVHDMEMVGVDPTTVRAHFRAALDAVRALLAGETVTVETPWFSIKNAVLQLRPYRDRVEIVVASSLSDEAVELLTETGTTPIVNLAPPYGTVRPGTGADPVATLTERVATYRAKSDDPARLRANVFVHLAGSAERGVDELIDGFTGQRLGLYRTVLGLPMPAAPAVNRKALESMVEQGVFVVGDAAACVARLQDLLARLGELETLAFFVPGWLPHAAVREQLTALAEEVVPALRAGRAGTAESIRIVSEEAARQAKLRAAMTVSAPVR
ncbi:LLM class flavin-dependent oxidoreductase [Dactylosporangium matsuzakiense]|uniref:Monooxygenase n=1 Tax=Dactylosporangium matsuzakiense TaxID=53360 RepID=A0A9W6NRF9_9ACTN|nr:LLM class flavin-dependent oxidoreductase [Dactylosporangium matsuzakiense]UWZ48547.1 LLM class flavin-dependent oxidoreductase [Dactylosporangium matsuzakiense]GLL06373.1 monooxygenase [Dactylosporangium matsuzakiense]